MKLNGGLGANVPVHYTAANDNRCNVNFRVHFGALADDQGVLALNLATEDAVDTHAPLELELPVEFGTSPEQGRDLGRRDLLFHADGPTRHRGPRATPDGFASAPQKRAFFRFNA